MDFAKPALPSVFRGVSWTALMQISSMLLGFAIAIASARILGVNDYSTLQLVIGWINIGSVVCGVGLATVVLRKSGEASSAKNWSDLKGLLRFALSVSALAVFAFGIIGLSSLLHLNRFDQFGMLFIGLLLIVVQQQRAIYQSLLAGQALFAQSGFGDFVANLLLALTLAGLLIVQMNAIISAENVLAIRLLATLLGLAFVMFIWLRHSRHNLPFLTASRPCYRPRQWLQAGLPIMLIAGASIVNANADILMIGALYDNGAAGPYHAATRGAGLVILSLSILIIPLSPTISKLHKSDPRLMFSIVFKWTLLAFGSSLAVAAALLVNANAFLSLFGNEFLIARTAMIILVLAQLVNVLVGPMQHILVMAGRERIAAACMFAGTATNIAANAILIPKHGMLGAAIGTALSIVVWNVLSVIAISLTVWKNAPQQTMSAYR
ncbi:oligosaccharide flippase family protein [Yoonia sp. MH D7]